MSIARVAVTAISLSFIAGAAWAGPASAFDKSFGFSVADEGLTVTRSFSLNLARVSVTPRGGVAVDRAVAVTRTVTSAPGVTPGRTAAFGGGRSRSATAGASSASGWGTGTATAGSAGVSGASSASSTASTAAVTAGGRASAGSRGNGRGGGRGGGGRR